MKTRKNEKNGSTFRKKRVGLTKKRKKRKKVTQEKTDKLGRRLKN